jgi:chromosome segregation ATPase
LRRSLADLGQARAGEHRELAEQLRLARERLADAEAQAEEHRSSAEGLRRDREALAASHRESGEAERSRLSDELQSTLDAERQRHAEELAEARARAEENERLADRLKDEIVSLSRSRSMPEADLEAARAEIADLRRKLADIETSRRSMSSLLEGMGIRLH